MYFGKSTITSFIQYNLAHTCIYKLVLSFWRKLLQIEGDMDQSDNTRVFVILNEIFFTHKWHFSKPFRYDTW